MNNLYNKFLTVLIVFNLSAAPSYATPTNTAAYATYTLAEQKNLLQNITDRAIKLRYASELERMILDHSHGEKNERSSEAEIRLSEEITEEVPDFTYGSSHLDSIAYFLRCQFGVDADTLKIVDEKRVETREFVVLDKKDKLVVKVFPLKTGSHFKLIHELSGNAAFRDLDLKKSTTVAFLDIGKYRHEGMTYILLAMEYVEGETFKKILEKLWNQYAQDHNKEAIASAQDLLYRLGEAIGEVHASGSREMPADPESHRAITAFYRKAIDEQLLKYEALGGEHTSYFRKFYSALLDQYTCTAHFFAPYHGDAHLENFLYDPVTETITIIDSVRAHVSVDSNNQALSDKFYMDVCRLESSLIKNLLKLDDYDYLIETLSPSLLEGWERMMKDKIDKSRFELEHYYTILTKIASAADWVNIADSRERELTKARLDLYENELFQQIAETNPSE